MPRPAPAQTRLADAVLRALAKRPWREIALADVAREAKIPLAKLAGLAPAKPALLGLILQHFGGKVTAAWKPDRSANSNRDRLFDVGMAWFDALAPHKRAVRSLYNGLKSDPLVVIGERSAIVSAAEWLMTLAEADKGPALALRATGFAAVLARAIPVWLDDAPDMSKTMAKLDGDLRRGESVLGKAPQSHRQSHDRS